MEICKLLKCFTCVGLDSISWLLLYRVIIISAHCLNSVFIVFYSSLFFRSKFIKYFAISAKHRSACVVYSFQTTSCIINGAHFII